MGPIMGALSTVGGWAKSVTDFGLTIITALIVLDILYPNSSYITENLARVVGDFGDQGVAGVIVVLLFHVLYRRG